MSKFSQTMFSSLARSRSAVASLWHHTVWLNVIVLFLTVGVAMLYIVQINHAATKGYRMRDLENEISRLDRENQKLEVAATEARSLSSISQKVHMLGLVKADTPVYRQAPSSLTLQR